MVDQKANKVELDDQAANTAQGKRERMAGNLDYCFFCSCYGTPDEEGTKM